MNYETALALVTLAELPRIGERRLSRVQALARRQHVSLPGVVALAPSALAREYGLPAPARIRLERDGFWHTAHCRALVARLAACGARVCEPGGAPYPQRWSERAEPAPPLAYLYGA